MFEEHALHPQLHDRAAFRCGEPALDEYLPRYAAQQHAKGVSNTFVLVDDAKPEQILGYYTLSAAHLAAQHLSDVERRKLPRYPIPCFRMGRLARCAQFRGDGLGKILLGLAVDRCLRAKEHVAAYALLVDAKHEKAAHFYRNFGFIACADSPLTWYMPLGI